MNEHAYKTGYGANFPMPARPAIYNIEIPIDATNDVRARRKAAHTARKEDYRLFAVHMQGAFHQIGRASCIWKTQGA